MTQFLVFTAPALGLLVIGWTVALVVSRAEAPTPVKVPVRAEQRFKGGRRLR